MPELQGKDTLDTHIRPKPEPTRYTINRVSRTAVLVRVPTRKLVDKTASDMFGSLLRIIPAYQVASRSFHKWLRAT